MTEAKSKEQWARGNKTLFNKFLLAKSAKFPPRDHPLTLSEWFQILHKDTWAPFVQKEIKMIRHFQMFNNYRYLNNLPEVQLGQFRQAIRSLGSHDAHTDAIKVDFATLKLPEVVFLPPLHSLIMDSYVGSIIFEHFARVMGRIHVQRGNLVAFNRFLFREYIQGHISSEVLAPLLSKCERLSPTEWARFYPLSAQQLDDLNASQAREHKPSVLAAEFLDMNSIHLVRDPFAVWVERYKVYVAMRLELKQKQIFYPVSIDQFLSYASFGKIMLFLFVLRREDLLVTGGFIPFVLKEDLGSRVLYSSSGCEEKASCGWMYKKKTEEEEKKRKEEEEKKKKEGEEEKKRKRHHAQYITQLAPLDIQTYAKMVKKAQLLEDATNFTDYIKGKFVKKEMTSGQSSAKPNNGKKRPFNITEGSSQERKPKVFVLNTPAKSNCKHCDKPGHTADECWKKVGACLRCGSRKHRIPNLFLVLAQPCVITGKAAFTRPSRQYLYRDLITTDLSSRSAARSARTRRVPFMPLPRSERLFCPTCETDDDTYTQEDGNDQE
ncbi:hypothetical protein Taro_041796 [Colocasia esculenta]|uniref:CCHC-type domain-containing protein n=1 Tax=Colocasia esculenta TaxID=4460 RepID=A0A843WMQ1_COLES|nr:hypothetical protein [Colocasia esculenta]